MRRVLSVLLFVLLLLGVLGSYSSFLIKRYTVRSEIRKLIKAKKRLATQTFRFSRVEYEQLNKYDGGKEFAWQGGMYDIVHQEIGQDSVFVRAYFDHEETDLLERFVGLFKSDHSSAMPTIPIQDRINLLEFVAQTAIMLPTPCFHCTRLPVVAMPLYSTFIEVQSPPPDCVSSLRG